MGRPRVLHVARDWVRPSEGFVADVVGTTTATVPFVTYGNRGSSPVPTVPATSLRALVDHGDRAVAAGIAAVGVGRRADVLHAHFGYWARHVAAAARRTRRPWVVSLHGHDLLVEGAPRADEADVVVVPSQFLADAASRAGIRDERLRVVPSGLDLRRLPFRERQPHEGPVLVTFAGRYVEKKGVLDAARALAGLPGIRARFVGFGPLEQDLRDLLVSLRWEAELVDGSVPGAVRDALQETDLLVTASKVAADGDAETLGLVNLEALACGVPVVTTRTGGVPEAVGAAATLVPEGDVAALRTAVAELVATPQSWAERGRVGRAHVVLHHELGSRVADLEQLWLALARRGRVPAVAPPRAALPTVSVVVVTAQRRSLVAQALQALEGQTYPSELVDVVVVDNASDDGTSDDLTAAPARVLREDRHQPVAAARNAAVRQSTADVVAFTDDDCRPVPTWLESLVAGLRQEVAIVQGATTADPGQPLEPLSRTQWTPAEAGLYETSNIAYTRAAFDAAGGFDESFAEDVAAVLGPHFGRYPFGEDTDLAWRVRRTGAATRFSATAVVHHEVFPPDPSYLLRRSVVGAGWPLLLTRVPELSSLLKAGFVLGRHRRDVLLALVGLVAGPRRPWALVATAPWVVGATRPLQPGRRARLQAVPVLATRDLVETVALVYGSVRARRLVL